jgi:hypothetical protein
MCEEIVKLPPFWQTRLNLVSRDFVGGPTSAELAERNFDFDALGP